MAATRPSNTIAAARQRARCVKNTWMNRVCCAPGIYMSQGYSRHWPMARSPLPAIEEGRFLTGFAEPELIAAFYRKQGASLVVVKLGEDGAYYETTCDTLHVLACSVETVVDTVGAGDGFAVGLISGLLEERKVADAVRRGAWIGARAVQVWGDTEGLPSRIELETAGY
jgi:sugar/nucleoside kinase (ribokinase family)